MDGDGQHDPEDLPRFMEIPDPPPLVIGNRMADPEGMPWMRRAVNWWMSRNLSRMLGCSLPDTQCGFRMMHLPSWAGLKIAGDHFEIESEIIVRFVRAGLGVGFVPIRVIYAGERTKIHPVGDTWRWFRWRWNARSRASSIKTSPRACEEARGNSLS